MPESQSKLSCTRSQLSSRPLFLPCLGSAYMLLTGPLEFLAYRRVSHQRDLNYAMAEKQTALVESRDGSSNDEDFTWTEEEEKALVRRSVPTHAWRCGNC